MTSSHDRCSRFIPFRPTGRHWSDATIFGLGLYVLVYFAWQVGGWGGSGSHVDGGPKTPVQKTDMRAAAMLQPGSENGTVRTGSYPQESETPR